MTNVTGFVAHIAYQHARTAYEHADAAYQYANVAYFDHELTEFVGAPPDVDADDADDVSRAPEIFAVVQGVRCGASNERLNLANALGHGANVVYD